MAVKTVYKTSDGTEFDNLNDASSYEDQLKIIEKLKGDYDGGDNCLYAGNYNVCIEFSTLMEFFRENKEFVRKLLTAVENTQD